MKRIVILFLLFGIYSGQNTYAQKTLQDKADERFRMLDYYTAIDYYRKVNKKTPSDSVKAKIAHSYMKLNNCVEAEYWYNKINEIDKIGKDHHFLLAEALEVNGDYEQAKIWYEKYKDESDGKDKRAQAKIDAINNIAKFEKDTINYEIERLEMNSTFNAFSPAFYADGIIFASDRRWEFGIKHKYQRKDVLYFDLFYVPLDTSKENYKKIRHFDANINSKFHEGQATLNAEGTEMIFTRNYYEHGAIKESENGLSKLSLYRAHSKDTNNEHGWNYVEELPLNNVNYSVGHPTATKDFKTLYFCSDMPGGFGGSDIYVTYQENGVWSSPKNLGEPVNTAGSELFPFISANGSLFFSSDGHGGLGGLDLYQANADADNNFVEVKNMGKPINSNMDDFSLIINDDFTVGYFATNRKEIWGDDLYRVRIKDNRFTLNGNVYSLLEGTNESNKKQLGGTEIQIVDKETGYIMARATSDSLGTFNVKLRIAHDYIIKASKSSYKSAEKELSFLRKTNLEPETTALTLLEPFTKIRLNVTVKDKQTNSPLSAVTLHVLNIGTSETAIAKSDNNGLIKIELSPYSKYVIKGQKIGYLSNCGQLQTTGATNETLQLDKPLFLKKIELEDKIVLQNVYFDVTKWDIRPDAALELDKVVTFIKEHPGITVEFGAHTDARGSDKYNLKLSQKRAESSVDYIVSQGISQDLISAKGYGETVLTNECASGVKCKEEEHQQNRRVEIKITGVKEPSDADKDAIDHDTMGIDANGNHADCQTFQITK